MHFSFTQGGRAVKYTVLEQVKSLSTGNGVCECGSEPSWRMRSPCVEAQAIDCMSQAFLKEPPQYVPGVYVNEANILGASSHIEAAN